MVPLEETKASLFVVLENKKHVNLIIAKIILIIIKTHLSVKSNCSVMVLLSSYLKESFVFLKRKNMQIYTDDLENHHKKEKLLLKRKQQS